MKTLMLLMVAAGLLVCGCATEDKGSQGKPVANASEKNPEVGMTKDQIIALYGKTDNQQAGSDGETWIYNLNMGEAFIPFNFGYRPKLRIIHFDKDGKVASWSYSK
jgi:outer membrane protein assembly factor BamE (lipoprotein component of BamABCDE complex)